MFLVFVVLNCNWDNSSLSQKFVFEDHSRQGTRLLFLVGGGGGGGVLVSIKRTPQRVPRNRQHPRQSGPLLCAIPNSQAIRRPSETVESHQLGGGTLFGVGR